MEAWKKVGPLQLIAKKFGISFGLQKFLIPGKDKEIDWTLIWGDGKTVVIFPITKNFEVVAIKEFKPGSEQIMLQLPCGNAEITESFLEGGSRELEEETGYKAENLALLAGKQWISFEPTHSKGNYKAIVAQNCVLKFEQKLDPTEDIEKELIPLIKWLEMIDSGKIVDSKSIAVTYLALRHLGLLELKMK